MRIRIAIAGAILLLAATTACGSDEQSPSNNSGATGTSTNLAEKPKTEGEPIDVKAELLKQGFKETQIAAIAKDSAYWLMPFNSPFQMSQKPGEPTCMFRIVREDFGTDPAKKAYVNYPIRSDSAVKVRTVFLNADGSERAVHGTDVTMPFAGVTPKGLADNKDLPLNQCGDTTLR